MKFKSLFAKFSRKNKHLFTSSFSKISRNNKLFLRSSFALFVSALLVVGFYQQFLLKPASIDILPETGDELTALSVNTAPINKKVLIVTYDPLILNSGKSLSVYKSWKSSTALVYDYINFFKTLSNNRINYSVQAFEHYKEFTNLAAGKKYDANTYLNCLADSSKCLRDSSGKFLTVDYQALITSKNYCQRFNNGDFDEIWFFAGPYFGFYDSTLAGNQAFALGGPAITGTTCNKPLPMMGFSFEKALPEMVNGFLTRAEATMQKVYGGWNRSTLMTNWDKFAYTAKDSNTNFSGCGWSDVTPVSTSAFAWNQTGSKDSYCAEFSNYPTIDINKRKPVSCNDWGCTEVGYYLWLLKHFPNKTGIGPDGKLNDWWQYVLIPEKASNVITTSSPN